MHYLDLFLRSPGFQNPYCRLLLLVLAGVVGSANFLLIAFLPWASWDTGVVLGCALFGNILCAMLIGLVVMLQFAKHGAGVRTGAEKTLCGARDYGKEWAEYLHE